MAKISKEREKLSKRLGKMLERTKKENLRMAIRQQKRMERNIEKLAIACFNRGRKLKCKYCGSTDLVKNGTYQGVQRYRCKKCGRGFIDNAALPHMHTASIQVGAILSAYYGGMSLAAVRRHITQQYGNCPSRSTIYRLITRFTKKAVEEAKKYKPEVGDVWLADETVLRVAGKRIDRLKRGVWFFDAIDSKTRFLLASHISQSRTTDDAEALMDKAWRRAGKAPRIVLTDKLTAYLDGVSIVFGRKTTKHIRSKGFTVQPNTNLIERFQGSLKDRTKVMRGLKSVKTARLLLDGWLVHYNFFRPHEALKGKTPAEKAGIEFPYKNWLDVVRQGSYPTHKDIGTGASLVTSNIGYHRNPARHRSHKIQARKTKIRNRATAPAIGVIR